MSQAALTPTWQSFLTTCTVRGVPLPRHQVVLYNDGSAHLFGVGGDWKLRLIDVSLEPHGDGGWKITGTNPGTGTEETWLADKVPENGGWRCGGCGKR